MNSTHILKQIIDEIKTDPIIKDEDDTIAIMRELCKKIQKEEDEKISDDEKEFFNEHSPKGAMIFLTIKVPYQKHQKEVSYLTLENDGLDGWSACYYVDFGGTGKNKLKKRHDIGAQNPNHVVTAFAKIYKRYLGREADNL